MVPQGGLLLGGGLGYAYGLSLAAMRHSKVGDCSYPVTALKLIGHWQPLQGG